MHYEEKITLLEENDFFGLFSRLGAEPRWVTSAGKRSLQILGLCHGSSNHSALFDPSSLKINCFSQCQGGMLLHTWVKKVLRTENPQEAKDFIEDWIENQDIDISNKIIRQTDFEYKERPYEPQILEPLKGITEQERTKLYSKFDTSLETLNDLVWHTQDGIDAEILQLYDVAHYPERGTIILPHHNIYGEIVGIYERNFRPLRKDVRKEHPELEYKRLVQYPRAKYVPLLKDEDEREEAKTSWSFPNSLNLYGLHKAKDAIIESGEVIVFEGAKSVMLARQYSHLNTVATHTFGIHFNHVSMLIACGAKKIILAFDKQYKEQEGQQWELYEKKTFDFAQKVNKYVQISRLIDKDGLLGFKDAPIDKGQEIFETLLKNEQILDGKMTRHEIAKEKERQENVAALAKIKKKNVKKERGQDPIYKI